MTRLILSLETINHSEPVHVGSYFFDGCQPEP